MPVGGPRVSGGKRGRSRSGGNGGGGGGGGGGSGGGGGLGGDTKLKDKRHRERIEIGRSLSNLNAIINGLARGDAPASLPFRESTLTWLLKEGLTHDAHVVMLATVSWVWIHGHNTQKNRSNEMR